MDPATTPGGHATPAMLAAHAGGALSAGLGLIVDGHLAHCAACRAGLARLEAVAAGLLAAVEAVPPGPSCLARALARLEAQDDEPEAAEADPMQLLRRLIADPAHVWRRLCDGVEEAPLDGFGTEAVSLVRGRPGARIPAHSHGGREAMLVLEGELQDGTMRHVRGGVALVSAGCVHGARIVGPGPCLCLMVVGAAAQG